MTYLCAQNGLYAWVSQGLDNAQFLLRVGSRHYLAAPYKRIQLYVWVRNVKPIRPSYSEERNLATITRLSMASC